MLKLCPWSGWRRCLKKAEPIRLGYKIVQSFLLTNADANQDRCVWCNAIVDFGDATLLKLTHQWHDFRPNLSCLPDTFDPCTTESHWGSFGCLGRCIEADSSWMERPMRSRCLHQTNFSARRLHNTSFSSERCPKPSCHPKSVWNPCWLKKLITRFDNPTWPTLFWRFIDFCSWVLRMSRKSFLKVIAAMPTAISTMKIIPKRTAN